MNKPGFSEANLGAVIGAVLGAIGGLIAVTLPLAILSHDIRVLASARTFALIGFLVSTPVGWLLGGQIGPRLAGALNDRIAAIIGGILGGLLPVSGFALWGWYLIQPK